MVFCRQKLPNFRLLWTKIAKIWFSTQELLKFDCSVNKITLAQTKLLKIAKKHTLAWTKSPKIAKKGYPQLN